jgi:hypothetical protein
MLDGAGEDVPRLGEIVASIEQALDRRAVARPLLDLVEHAVVRIERVARFLVRPIAHGHESRTVGVARSLPCDRGRPRVDLPGRPHHTATVKRVDLPIRNTSPETGLVPSAPGAVAPEPLTRCHPATPTQTRRNARRRGSPRPLSGSAHPRKRAYGAAAGKARHCGGQRRAGVPGVPNGRWIEARGRGLASCRPLSNPLPSAQIAPAPVLGAFSARRAAAQSARRCVDFRGSPPLGNHPTNAAVCQSVRGPGAIRRSMGDRHRRAVWVPHDSHSNVKLIGACLALL